MKVAMGVVLTMVVRVALPFAAHSVPAPRSGLHDDLASDKAALLAFKASAGRHVWPPHALRGWTSAEPVCSWQGIVCDDDERPRHVTRLMIGGTRHITADIGELGKLRHMERLLLGNTNVFGNIGDLATCKAMYTLDLERTNVLGSIESLRGLRKLYYLTLTGTKVHGRIDAMAKVKSLAALEVAQTNIGGRGLEHACHRCDDNGFTYDVCAKHTCTSGKLTTHADKIAGSADRWCCVGSPCFGKSHRQACGLHGDCSETTGNCICLSGYSGDHCQQRTGDDGMGAGARPDTLGPGVTVQRAIQDAADRATASTQTDTQVTLCALLLVVVFVLLDRYGGVCPNDQHAVDRAKNSD